MFPVLRAGPRRVLLGLSATLGVFLIGYLIAPLISSLWEHWVSRHPVRSQQLWNTVGV